MRTAKAFFFVATGMFLLALGWHIGARSAGAQSPTLVATVAARADGVSYVAYILVEDRSPFVADETGDYQGIDSQRALPAVPGTSPIVAANAALVLGPEVMLENGDVYRYSSGSWQLKGNVLGGPTPVLEQSWGQLKSRYRGEPSDD